jgi:hypothetical protein
MMLCIFGLGLGWFVVLCSICGWGVVSFFCGLMGLFYVVGMRGLVFGLGMFVLIIDVCD